jgi:hypothetical protein
METADEFSGVLVSLASDALPSYYSSSRETTEAFVPITAPIELGKLSGDQNEYSVLLEYPSCASNNGPAYGLDHAILLPVLMCYISLLRAYILIFEHFSSQLRIVADSQHASITPIPRNTRGFHALGTSMAINQYKFNSFA